MVTLTSTQITPKLRLIKMWMACPCNFIDIAFISCSVATRNYPDQQNQKPTRSPILLSYSHRLPPNKTGGSWRKEAIKAARGPSTGNGDLAVWDLPLTAASTGVSRRGPQENAWERLLLEPREPQAHQCLPPGFLKQTAPNLQNIKSQMGYAEWSHRQGARIPVCCRNRPGLDLSLLSSDKLEAGTDPKIQNKMAFNCD